MQVSWKVCNSTDKSQYKSQEQQWDRGKRVDRMMKVITEHPQKPTEHPEGDHGAAECDLKCWAEMYQTKHLPLQTFHVRQWQMARLAKVRKRSHVLIGHKAGTVWVKRCEKKLSKNLNTKFWNLVHFLYMCYINAVDWEDIFCIILIRIVSFQKWFLVGWWVGFLSSLMHK